MSGNGMKDAELKQRLPEKTNTEVAAKAGNVGCWKFLLPMQCHYRGHEVVDAKLVRAYEAHIEGECDACGCAMEPPDEDTYVVVDGVTTQRYVWLCGQCSYEHASWETTPEPWMIETGAPEVQGGTQ